MVGLKGVKLGLGRMILIMNCQMYKKKSIEVRSEGVQIFHTLGSAMLCLYDFYISSSLALLMMASSSS
jgi:hypothetical protein